MLGDKLLLREYVDYLPKAKTDREKNNIIARIKRLGVNLPIQGSTSTIMSSGFFNDIRVSKQEGWSKPLQPIITVHDSNTSFIPVSMLYDIRKFYDKNFTEFCASVGPKIRLLFDLLVGTSYEGATTMKTIDDDTVEFTGSTLQILSLYDKIMSDPESKSTCSMTRDEIISKAAYVDNAVRRFIIENGCSMMMDRSKLTVQFHRVN